MVQDDAQRSSEQIPIRSEHGTSLLEQQRQRLRVGQKKLMSLFSIPFVLHNRTLELVNFRKNSESLAQSGGHAIEKQLLARRRDRSGFAYLSGTMSCGKPFECVFHSSLAVPRSCAICTTEGRRIPLFLVRPVDNSIHNEAKHQCQCEELKVCRR